MWFSRSGTLVATVEAWVTQSPTGYFADELARALHVEVHDVLRSLTTQGRLRRTDVSGVYLYTAAESTSHRRQAQARRTAHAVPIAVAASALQIAPDELGAALLLFYSLLDEQQRRLYAGLESLRLGHGGDAQLAAFLGVDPHTVARGRQQLLDQDISAGRVRRAGGGRPSVEKKRPT